MACVKREFYRPILQIARTNLINVNKLPLKQFQRTLSKGIIAAKEPFEVSLIQGKKYSWCKCGFSDKQPFCDGQHKKKAPGISPIRFKAEKTGTVYLCGCKQTNSAPYCDGSHLSDEVQKATLNQ